MSVNQLNKVRALPIDRGEEWLMERRSIDVPVKESGKETKPDLLICVSLTSGMIIGDTIIEPDAPDSQVIEWAYGCMLKPIAGKPHRPGKVELTGGKIKYLQAALLQVGVQSSASSMPHPLVDEIAADLVTDLNSSGLPPYTIGDVKPDAVAEFFEAASDYFKLHPWELLESEVPIKLELLYKTPVTYWAIVMGSGGEEFGLNLFRSAEELLGLFNAENEDQLSDVGHKTWSVAFSYDDFDKIGSIAQAECIAYGWNIADKSAYPSALVVNPKAKVLVNRPNRNELADITAATIAITKAFSINKEQIEKHSGIIRAAGDVEVGGRCFEVVATIPAPEFVEIPEPLQQAQIIVAEAWEARTKAKRVELAKKALDINPDCADAYLVLAHEAKKDDEKGEYLRQAVEAGKRIIGDKFDSLVGKFWSDNETQPYMRAKINQADFFKDIGYLGRAIDEYMDMLRLNPVDNQGARYDLYNCFITAGRDKEAHQLLNEYKEDTMAIWLYTMALLSFRESGPSKKADQQLNKAIAENKYVVDYLLGRKRIPREYPEFYRLGSKEEAIIYANTFKDTWKATEGALDWLKGINNQEVLF